MALRNVLHFPHPRLRLKAKPVTVFDGELETLINDMFETMYAEDGIGLAATQIDVQLRVLVLDISDDRKQPMCFINPEILEKSGHEKTTEGCLSVPGIFDLVERAEKITVQYQDRTGQQHTLDADGLLAVCIQHEMDHLNGKLFIDYLSELKRDRIEKKLKKLQKIKF